MVRSRRIGRRLTARMDAARGCKFRKCGIRNAELGILDTRVRGWFPPFRIPHSAFRITKMLLAIRWGGVSVKVAMEELLRDIACALNRLVELTEARSERCGDSLVTRSDLNAMEARLTTAINASKDLDDDDKKALAELSAGTAARVRKLERLDARTPKL